MKRVLAFVMMAPATLTGLYFGASLLVAKLANCGDWNAARIPDCTLFGFAVGGFVYGSIATGYYLAASLVWMFACLVIAAVILAISKPIGGSK